MTSSKTSGAGTGRSTSMSKVSRESSSLELTGHKFKGNSCDNDPDFEEWDIQESADCLILKSQRKHQGMHGLHRLTHREYTHVIPDSPRGPCGDPRELRNCLHVHPSYHQDPSDEPNDDNAADKKKYYKAFTRNADKVNYNNPYRHLKHKERLALATNKKFEFTSLESYIQFNTEYGYQNGRQIMLPRSVLRVPNPCSDTFLLQMMLEMNKPCKSRSRVSSAKYSDVDDAFVEGSRASSSQTPKFRNIYQPNSATGGPSRKGPRGSAPGRTAHAPTKMIRMPAYIDTQNALED
jgi:hypothetical protein